MKLGGLLINKTRIVWFFIIIAVILTLLSSSPVFAQESSDGKWMLVDTVMNPNNEPSEFEAGGTFAETRIVSESEIVTYYNWEVNGETSDEKLFTLNFHAPPELIPGETFEFQFNATTDYLVPESNKNNKLYGNAYIYLYNGNIAEGFEDLVDKNSVSWTEIESSMEGEDPVKSGILSFTVHEKSDKQLILNVYGPQLSANVFFVYNFEEGTTQKKKITLEYVPGFGYNKPYGAGSDFKANGDLIATVKEEEKDKLSLIEGEIVLFFIEKETPAIDEPGKNLFEVLNFDSTSAADDGWGSLWLGNAKAIEFFHGEINDEPRLGDRIYLGKGVYTNTDGEAKINFFDISLIDPEKFVGELISQKYLFGENGKISGTIIAGVLNETTKKIEPQTSFEIEFTAMAQILKIGGAGIRDDSTSFCYPQNDQENLRPPCPPLNREFPGKVRVKRTLTYPTFEFKPVEEGFLLMPGDIIDIDGGTLVQIAWITGDEVLIKVPSTIKPENVRIPLKVPHIQLILLSSAYDSGFKTDFEKITSYFTGFTAKKGSAFIIQSLGGKPTKLIFQFILGLDLKDIDINNVPVGTRIRIRSKVIIDTTGDELKVYNIEGSPDIKTAAGEEVTLKNQETVSVTDEGSISPVETFDGETVENEFYEDTETLKEERDFDSDEDKTIVTPERISEPTKSPTIYDEGTGESGGMNLSTLLFVLIIIVVGLVLVVGLKKQLIPMNNNIAVLLVVILFFAMGAMFFSGGENAQQTSTPTTLSLTSPPVTIPLTPKPTSPPTTLPATAPPAIQPVTTPPQTTLPPETSPPTTNIIPTTTITLPPTTITATSTIIPTTTTTEPKPTLELVDETIVDNVEDKFWLGGNVRNNGETEVFSVRVRLTLYNEMGSIMQTINSVAIDRIGPGETIEFNTIKSDKITTAVARYEVSIHTG
jgi:hypothetical protein